LQLAGLLAVVFKFFGLLEASQLESSKTGLGQAPLTLTEQLHLLVPFTSEQAQADAFKVRLVFTMFSHLVQLQFHFHDLVELSLTFLH
jgi:hypothetical protein